MIDLLIFCIIFYVLYRIPEILESCANYIDSCTTLQEKTVSKEVTVSSEEELDEIRTDSKAVNDATFTPGKPLSCHTCTRMSRIFTHHTKAFTCNQGHFTSVPISNFHSGYEYRNFFQIAEVCPDFRPVEFNIQDVIREHKRMEGKQAQIKTRTILTGEPLPQKPRVSDVSPTNTNNNSRSVIPLPQSQVKKEEEKKDSLPPGAVEDFGVTNGLTDFGTESKDKPKAFKKEA